MSVTGFVALGWNSNKAAISADGVSWSSITLPVTDTWYDVAWNGTNFCAIAYGSDVAVTSPDGVTWTARTMPSVQGWRAIEWNGTVFCAIVTGANVAATSPDGVTWTARTLPSVSNWSAITWSGTKFCIVSESGGGATSADGITWTARTLSSAGQWMSVAWNGTVFCAIGWSSALSTSPDGITWTARTPPDNVQWGSIIANGTTFCALATDNSAESCTSTDNGVTWSLGGGPLFKNWYKVRHITSGYCALGSNIRSTITSTDGLTWTENTNSLPSIAYWKVQTTGLVTIVNIYNDTVISNIEIDSIGSFIYTLNNIISDILNLHLDSTNINTTVILDSISYNELLTYLEINNIVETILLQESCLSKNTINNTIIEYFTIIDAILIKYLLTVSESIIYTPDLLGIITQIENIVSAIIINSNSDTKALILNNIIDLLSIIDIISAGFSKTISESIVITDVITQLSKLINILTESITINSSDIVIYTGLERISSSINTIDIESDKVTAKTTVSESFIISIPTASGQDNYLAYLLSPETNSVTNYNNYNFKGCTKFNSKYLFYNDTGLYEYGGSTDNGELIEAHITTAAFNFGSTNLKQVPSVYLGTSNSDKVYLKVSIDGKANCLYTLNKKTTGLQTQKVDIGKGMIGRYFQFELITKADTFDLESIDFYPIELKRKL